MKLEELISNLDNITEEIAVTCNAFPWGDKEAYAMWLKQTYSFVCHSTRLLTLTSAYCKNDKFHYRFMDHAVEEKAHELLLERDFKELGVDKDNYEELLSTAGIYQIQYYWIQHVNPITLFGYVLLLENLAVKLGRGAYELAKESFGDKACNFLRVHIEEDEDHLPKAFKALENASSEEIELINRALYLTGNFYNDSLKTILNMSGPSKKDSVSEAVAA